MAQRQSTLEDPAVAARQLETHPTFKDPIQGTMYRLHCTHARCGAYIDDVKDKPAQDYLCDDCLENT